MIYRVTLAIGYTQAYFEFKTAIDAMTFLDMAVRAFAGTDDDRKFKASLTMEKDEAPTDEE